MEWRWPHLPLTDTHYHQKDSVRGLQTRSVWVRPPISSKSYIPRLFCNIQSDEEQPEEDVIVTHTGVLGYQCEQKQKVWQPWAEIAKKNFFFTPPPWATLRCFSHKCMNMSQYQRQFTDGTNPLYSLNDDDLIQRYHFRRRNYTQSIHSWFGGASEHRRQRKGLVPSATRLKMTLHFLPVDTSSLMLLTLLAFRSRQFAGSCTMC